MFKTLGILVLGSSLVACSNGTSFGVGPEKATFDSSIKYNNKVDIIWVVDDSSSMRQHQQKLANEIGGMISKLDDLKMDYRMVVTTTSVGNGFNGGKYVGSPKILSKGDANLANTLKSRIVYGESGSDKEQGVLSLQNLLSENYIENEGQGFHRDESLLLINILSDEDDQTDGTSASVLLALRNRLDQLKKPFRPGVGGWIANFIGVKDTTCKDGFGRSNIGYRYLDLAQSSNGKSFSICETNLKEAVASLQKRVLEIATDYPLASVPNVDTIRVYMNGVLVPHSNENGWDYVPASQLVRFYGNAVPSADVQVTVDYTPAGAT
jgi:hypothetical protein